ncbi:MAG: hypothetical protein AB1Z98_13405 [Nannocystaceae bacterium]
MTTQALPRISSLTVALALAGPTAAFAADINGDGIDDVLVGAHRFDVSGQDDAGAVGILLGSQDVGLVAGTLEAPLPQAGARAGFSVATGDFDCDGDQDLAYGAPSTDTMQAPAAGAVWIYTNDNGVLSNTSYFTRDDFDIIGDVEVDDHFGRALVSTDLDGDQCDDLAIGAPRARDGEGGARAGIVYVAWGSAWDGSSKGLKAGKGSNNRIDYVTANHDNARFGFSLAAGDFDGDGVDDLVISAPTDSSTGSEVGQIQVRNYNAGASNWGLPIRELTGSVDGGWFGWALATGDFDGNGHAALAAGVPGYQDELVGRVEIYKGNSQVLSLDEVISDGGVAGRYGYALTVGDLDIDGLDELVVGSPTATAAGGPDRSGVVWMYTDSGNGMVELGELTPMDFGGSNYGTGQKFGCSLAMGYYSGLDLDLAIGAKRAKADNSVRTGAVFMYRNEVLSTGAMVPGTKNSLEDFGQGSASGALFGSALSQ